MNFFEWLADELANTDDDEIEIGFNKEDTVNDIMGKESNCLTQ